MSRLHSDWRGQSLARLVVDSRQVLDTGRVANIAKETHGFASATVPTLVPMYGLSRQFS
jgi:hypothetical protein